MKDQIDGEIDMDMHGNVQFKNYNKQDKNSQTEEEVKTGI